MTRVLGFCLLLAAPVAAGDWRADLLKAEGFGLGAPELRRAMSGGGPDDDKLEAAYRLLASESFPEREQAQRTLLANGPAALTWLRGQPESDDPEVRMRVAAIRQSLELISNDRYKRMIRHAASTLLDELDGQPDPATGGIFYEWFGETAPQPDKRYRGFHLKAPRGMKSRVGDRMLQHLGERPGDDDQSLILKAADWPGTETFPAGFTVMTTLGGKPGGAGAWHLGVAIGRVRALYHPGYAGGGFRFERVDGNVELTANRSMGFTPSTEQMQQMRITVRQLGRKQVQLSVTVTQEGEKPFESSIEVDSETIGPLDQISLDRSGRTGGDARFSELMVELGAP